MQKKNLGRAVVEIKMRLVGLGMALLLGACEATEVASPSAPPASAAAPVAPPVTPTPTASGDDPCTAVLPTAAGAGFAGVVRHVIDGDSLCVGPADSDGSTWIEVRLMDFDAPEHNQAGGAAVEETLTRLALGRPVECVVTPGRSGTRSWDRTHAVCRLNGEPLGDLLRGAGATEGGN